MNTLIPQKLSPGDTVGIIAPSTPVLPSQEARLHEGLALLSEMGFNGILGQHLRSTTLGFCAAPEEKADDIHVMFGNASVKAIICAQGGDTANTPLPLLDWVLIQRNPKIFIGLSDITVLLNAIHHKTGLITYHGNDILWGFGNQMADYEREEVNRILIAGHMGPYPPNRSRKMIRGGQAQGRLMGGNIRCLLKLAGTPFWPDFRNAILFLEAYEISAEACHNAFHQLKQIGVFEQIKGVLIGYIDSMQRENLPRPWMEDVLLEVTKEYNFPILKFNDFGHNCPNTVLPVGAESFMDADRLTLELISPCVRA